MLPQYYGLYSIEVGRRSAHFIIMNYWFATMHEINLRYDLKGSTKGRRASAKERAKGPTAIYKDLDRIERGTIVENRMASEIKAAIANDVEFMRRNRLIDYSMMLGVHFKTDGTARDGDDADAGAEKSPGHHAGSESDAQGVVSSDGGGAFDERSGGVPGPQTQDAPPSAAVLAAERDEPQPPSARDPRGGGRIPRRRIRGAIVRRRGGWSLRAALAVLRDDAGSSRAGRRVVRRRRGRRRGGGGAGAGDWRGSSRASRWNGRDPSFSARRTTERCSFSCERWTPRRGWRTSGSSTSSRSTRRRRRRRRSGADTSSDAARTYLASRRAGTPDDFCACWTACWWSREGRDRRWGAEGRAAGVRGGRWTWPGRTRAPECLRD